MSNAALETAIEAAWEGRDAITPATKGETRDAVEATLAALGAGTLRVAEKRGADWHVNQWAKKAVLLGFRLQNMGLQSGGPQGGSWWDKVDSKFLGWGEAEFKAAGFRAVPNCIVRKSAHIAKGVVLMPSFVNLGAYFDEGTMVDTWATVGSCAQIGKNVHLSGGVGIGGVLEPLQAVPVIIEDDCFIGARSEVIDQSAASFEHVAQISRHMSLLLGIAISACAPVFFPYLTDAGRSFVTAILCAWCAAAATVLGSYPPCYRRYVWAFAANVWVAWLFYGTFEEIIAVGGFVASGAIVLVQFSARIGELIEESVHIRNERNEFVAQLERALEENRQPQITRARFLAAACHDMRQPVHAMQLLAGLLGRYSTNDRQKEIVQKHRTDRHGDGYDVRGAYRHGAN